MSTMLMHVFKNIDNENSKFAYHSEKVFNAQKLGRILTNFL